jgi:hypothetical protein
MNAAGRCKERQPRHTGIFLTQKFEAIIGETQSANYRYSDAVSALWKVHAADEGAKLLETLGVETLPKPDRDGARLVAE